MHPAIFAYFAAAIVGLSIAVVSMRHPVRSVLLMLVLFFHLAAMYLFLQAEFMAAIQIIVYAGAILVLFLFVVLLLNLKKETAKERLIGAWPLSLTFVLTLGLMTLTALGAFRQGPSGVHTAELIQSETNTVLIGRELFTNYLLPFELVSLVLLVGIIGAVVLAKKSLKS